MIAAKLYKRVALFVLMMILPLNLIALSVTRDAMDATIEQTVATDRQFAETCVDNDEALDYAYSDGVLSTEVSVGVNDVYFIRIIR